MFLIIYFHMYLLCICIYIQGDPEAGRSRSKVVQEQGDPGAGRVIQEQGVPRAVIQEHGDPGTGQVIQEQGNPGAGQ